MSGYFEVQICRHEMGSVGSSKLEPSGLEPDCCQELREEREGTWKEMIQA